MTIPSVQAMTGRTTSWQTKIVPAATIVLISVIFTRQVLRIWPATIDDAFIAFRYSEHWAHGLGLTFNAGERVEGFSNFLWVAILALASRIGLDITTAAKGAGLLSLVATLILGVRALRAHGQGQFGLVAGFCLLALSNFPLFFQALGGLETIFYAALLMAVLDRLRIDDNRLTLISALLFVLIALTRPEGIAYALALAPVLWWLRRKREARPPLLWIGVFVAYAVFLLWRWRYFGNWLPNTFYAKTSVISLNGFLGLIANAWWITLELTPLVNTAGGALTVAFALYAAADPETRQRFLPTTTVTVTGLLFQLYAGPDWMNMARFALPVWTPFLVLVFVGWGRLTQTFAQNWRNAGLAVWIGVAAILNLRTGSQFWQDRALYPNFVLISEDMISASQWIAAHYPSTYSIVCWRIGALAYYSNLTVIDDSFGLTDKTIAHLRQTGALTEQARNAYLAARNPELIMGRAFIGSAQVPEITVGGRQYRFVRRFPQGSTEWWDLYERSDLGG